ncbi:ABC-type transport system involved in Fe-S cluster assembly, permease and ATPase components [Hahella chejuensis KCTC 2396]|uniref:ABC-type transport system involved in Fe-S cluster assembly, permease and ATPase components n=1 Tax=Hahella chejuensis (strain KCTC 2396) TaxID=349521 RepID=Q2SPJ9_HAHCH|nr:ABC transporter ATP-binding protein/permease [Hahella chejuensis]ABC27425.1 ABC-type transport system involved in Fe-S cluster assembly, permease and ATPase components [Hahella chejuensis KCTC 2396]
MRRSSSATDAPDNEAGIKTLRSLWPYLLEHKRRVLLALLCLLGAKGASVGLPFILKYIIDSLDSGRANIVVGLPLALLLAYGAARLGNVLFGEVRDALFGRVTERAMRRIGLQAFQHLHSLDLDFHLNRNTGGLSRDIERGLSGISFLMRFMVFNIAPTLLEILMVISLLLINYSLWFALITFIAVVLYVAYSVVATDWRTEYVREANRADSESNTRVVDSLLNYETVKYFTNEEYEAQRYDADLARWERARRKNRLSLFVLNGGQALIVALAMTSMMILAAQNVVMGEMTLGDFALINAFMMQLFMPLNFLGFIYREMKGSLANIEQLFVLLRRTSQVPDKAGAPDLRVEQGALEFSDVHFGYSAQRPILQGVSFRIEPQRKVAVVGGSGAGKSTLVKLLFRFYDVNGGAISVDGQDIREVALKSLRSAIAIVPQDTVLFNDTIYENIRYGCIDATEEEVWRAIRMAHLERFVQHLPEGVNTLVGERGLKLSGGEKQRVAIARAILKNPPILVFDEATSSLDSKSEQSVLKAIQEVSQGQTSLVIAHRLSTIIDADLIVVLQEGKVVEQGTHAELLARNGVYANLWRIQQREDTEAPAVRPEKEDSGEDYSTPK